MKIARVGSKVATVMETGLRQAGITINHIISLHLVRKLLYASTVVRSQKAYVNIFVIDANVQKMIENTSSESAPKKRRIWDRIN